MSTLCGDCFAAPLGSSRSGHLRFTNGAHWITIRADRRMQSLCSARFGKWMPTIGVHGGIVTIRHLNVSSRDWLDCRSECPAEVALNARIPWGIEVRGGASQLVADLRGLRIGSLSVAGGVGRMEVFLPVPSGTVDILFLGGASNVAIHRPEGIAARLRVGGGATLLKFDDRGIGAAGGELDLRSRHYDGATDRYAVAVTGGANNVTIDERREVKGSGARRHENPRSGPDHQERRGS